MLNNSFAMFHVMYIIHDRMETSETSVSAMLKIVLAGA